MNTKLSLRFHHKITVCAFRNLKKTIQRHVHDPSDQSHRVRHGEPSPGNP